MNGQIERDDAAAFAESVSAKLNNIVHFDPDKELNGKLDEIKGGFLNEDISIPDYTETQLLSEAFP